MHAAESHRFLIELRRRATHVGAAFLFALLSLAAQAQATGGEADPPGRVGRISYLSGPVQLIDARSGQGELATLNWPITSGLRLATGRLGRAEVRIGSLALRLDDDTDIEFTRIDDEAMQIVALRGTMAVRVRNREHLRELDLLTPRDRIVIEDVGRYRIDVDRVASVTGVTTYAGHARILSGKLIFAVAGGQRGELDASAVTSFRLVAAVPDVFDDWVAARERHDDAPRSVQYASAEMTGVESLDEQGKWRTVDAYGPVWFPSYVPAGWVPYRFGRWGYVAPWGWTWIDDAPWGFAPFHYGRWVVVGGVWGWYPGVIVPRPVFAPALVAWFGQPGLNVSINIGAPIGWFPLGPGEVFIPAYRCSRRCINVVNVSNVTNITQVTVINPPPRYVHHDHDRTTWAPGSALVDRSPVQRVVMPPPADWHNRVAVPRPPIEPPRDIKKRPTPVPMPPRDAGNRPLQEAARPLVPPAAATAVSPGAPAVPAARPDDPRRLRPNQNAPSDAAPRAPVPLLAAPATPAVPATRATPASPATPAIPATRAMPASPAAPAVPATPAMPRAPLVTDNRRVVPSDDATAHTRRAPPVAAATRSDRAPPRTVPQAPPTAPPVSPPVVQQPPGRDAVRAHDERAAREQRRAQAENRNERPQREGPNRANPRE